MRLRASLRPERDPAHAWEHKQLYVLHGDIVAFRIWMAEQLAVYLVAATAHMVVTDADVLASRVPRRPRPFRVARGWIGWEPGPRVLPDLHGVADRTQR